jgi:hypothetical protein
MASGIAVAACARVLKQRVQRLSCGSSLFIAIVKTLDAMSAVGTPKKRTVFSGSRCLWFLLLLVLLLLLHECFWSHSQQLQAFAPHRNGNFCR